LLNPVQIVQVVQSLRSVQAVSDKQSLKFNSSTVQGGLPRFENSRNVERFAKKVEAMQFDNIGEEQRRFARFAKIGRGTIWVAKPRCDAATVNSAEGIHNVEALRL
jgi:hypothetical protein